MRQKRLAESGAGGAPMCARPSFVTMRPRGVRWRKPSWSRYGSYTSSIVSGDEWERGVDTREQPLWDEHAAFMDDLFERGLVRLAGPIVDAGGEALSVMEGESEAALRELLAADPWCRDRDVLRVGRIRGWRIFLDATAR